MIERSWLGRRVTVRRAVPHGDSGAVRFSDVVGDLVALSADTAAVDTRRGPVEIALAEVAVARIAPPSTADELALAAIAADGWRPAETSAVGGWRLRASGGFTKRGNSVLPLRAPGVPLDEALAIAGEWYAARGLPPRLQIPTAARRLLDIELGERGWAPSEDVAVLAARLDMLHAREPAVPVELAAAPDEDWLGCSGRAQGSPDGCALLTRHDRAVFATVRDAGATVAVGRGAVDGDWLGVTALHVVESHRRRRLATAVMAALWEWGARAGARRSYLEVETGNRAALALYAGLGYWQHHAYRYRTAP